MMKRFTKSSIGVVTAAKDMAKRDNSDAIRPEHILLALAHAGAANPTGPLGLLGASLEHLEPRIAQTPGSTLEPAGFRVLRLSSGTLSLVKGASVEASRRGVWYVSVEHIYLSLISQQEEDPSLAGEYLELVFGSLDRARDQLLEAINNCPRGHPDFSKDCTLDAFARNLTREVDVDSNSSRLPIWLREKEATRVLQILLRRTRNLPVLTCEPGIDSLAVLQFVAMMTVEAEVPTQLLGRNVYYLPGDLDWTETKTFKGEEVTLESALQEAAGRDDILFFIDEIHRAFEQPPSNPLRELLRAPGVLVVGGTTPDDFLRYVSSGSLVSARVQEVVIAEHGPQVTREILRAVRDNLESYYRVSLTDEALDSAAELAGRYIRDSFLPDSALDLIDEAASRTTLLPPEAPKTRDLDEMIAKLRATKEAAIDDEDFEAAASLREKEKTLMAEREHLWSSWETGARSDYYSPYYSNIPELNKDHVINVLVDLVSARTGVSAARVASSLTLGSMPAGSSASSAAGTEYSLLNDEPLHPDAVTRAEDLLGSELLGSQIALILERAPTPFVLAIDGGWGVGKSTLLNQIDYSLSDETIRVRYNAWTANDKTTFESLIKSVLVELDANVLRRWTRRIAKRRGVKLLGYGGLLLGGRLLGVNRLTDRLWDRLDIDEKSRNELRSNLKDIISDWYAEGSNGDGERKLIIFIDDLDRCSDSVVADIAEIVKLYLGVPGLLFVLACDMSVLSRNVSSLARGGTAEGRRYLEKIVQASHRVPVPDRKKLEHLVRAYAAQSHVGDLLDAHLVSVIADGTGGNPRRIKLIINSFVLQYYMDSTWERRKLGRIELMTIVLIQHLFPSFHEYLVEDKASDDPIGDFLDYADVRSRAASPPPPRDAWWSIVGRLFRRSGLATPPRVEGSGPAIVQAISQLEELLPKDFPLLARNEALLSLLRSIGDDGTARDIHSILVGTFAE